RSRLAMEENQKELEFQQARVQQEQQEGGPPPPEEAGFAAKEQEQGAQGAQDEAQKNQFLAGGQPTEGTLAAALPPEQVNALAALRAKLAGQAPKANEGTAQEANEP